MAVVGLIVAGCGDKLVCGGGTHAVDGACVPTASGGADTAADDTGHTTPLGLDKDEDGFATPTDCDDADPAVHPEANEYCDGIDNDCDGQIDEADALNTAVFYTDSDGDGYGDADAPVAACEPPEGTVEDATDCDDDAASAYPGAEEVWYDGIDNDCLGGSDDDIDGDGYAGSDDGTGEDCSDEDAEIHPGAEEICGDGIDNNCDGDLGDCGLIGDLTGDMADARLLGPDHDAWAGESVAVSADLTGDGVGDLVVGAPRDDAGGVNAGAAYVVPGTVFSVSLMAELGHRINGLDDGAMAGSFVATGDVNGDGADDLMIGAPYAGAIFEDSLGGDTGDTGDAEGTIVTTTVDQAGSLSIVFGPIDGSRTTADADVQLFGETAAHGVGTSATVLGDQDGDGFAELVIGLPGDDSRYTDAGGVRIISGPVGTATRISDGYLLSGDATGDRAGTALTAPGDLNGDGIADLVVTAPAGDTTVPGGTGEVNEDAGAVYVVLGPILRDLFLADADGLHLGLDAGDRAGTSAAAADMDGDGTPDILIGAPGVDGETGDEGTIYVVAGPATLSGPLALAAAQLVGADAGGEAGGSMASAGDADGDGQADLVVGAPRAMSSAGRVALVYGPVVGTVDLADAPVRITGAGTNHRLGFSVAGGVDLSGDGFLDIVIGAPGEDTAGDGAGAALIFFASGS